MEVGDSASGVANQGWWSLFLTRGTGDCVPTTGGSHLLSLPGKVYARVLERRIPDSHPGFRRNNAVFVPGRGTLDQLYTLHRRVLEGLWEFAQPVHMCFVDLEKAFEPCPSWYSVGSATHLQIRGHGSRPRKRVACPLRVGGQVLPQVEEFKYLGVLFTSEGKMEREIDRRLDWYSVRRIMRSMYRTVVVKKEAKSKGEALSIYRSIYTPTLTYGHELWVMTEMKGQDQRIQVARNEFPPQAEVARASVSDASLGRRSRHVPPGGGAPGRRPRTHWRDYVSRLAWERLGVLPGRAGGSVWGEGSLGISAQTAASATRSRISGGRWMDGWMDVLSKW
ncbi:hypothetical protein L3Q82_014714 [Scortum barcoo]|uniref:Uncharacterized protein n=1 Tax=Scortum barcoo TaxID=214431 RepID=A0ACB8VSK8_9TELE|nr:hypothetical protein L3Q82_014714 [Scortum barcoo]